MTAANYKPSLKVTLSFEGGWSNHPSDPGGATFRGVTQRVYDAYRVARGLPKQSVRYIGEAELQAIYRQMFADKISFDDLPAGIDLAVFDAAVNSGPQRAAMWLQQALGVVVDGVIGPATLLAANSASNKATVIVSLCAARRAFVRRLKIYTVFGRGWERRIAGVQAAALAMAAGKALPAQELPDASSKARARVEDAKPRPSKKVADAATGAGVATGTVAGSLTQAQQQLEPLAGTSEVVNVIIAVLAVVSVALVVGGLGWRWWKTRQAEEYAADLNLPAQVAT